MARVRGRLLIDGVGFVRDTFGADAPARVFDGLPAEARGVFHHGIREQDWYPIPVFVAYLVAAKRILAPKDDAFYRRQGRYAGERQKSFLGAMASSLQTQRMMAPTIWRMYFDVGRLVVVEAVPGQPTCQIHDFPTTQELCERLLGAWEGVVSAPGRPAAVREIRCALRGAPCCEVAIVSPTSSS